MPKSTLFIASKQPYDAIKLDCATRRNVGALEKRYLGGGNVGTFNATDYLIQLIAAEGGDFQHIPDRPFRAAIRGQVRRGAGTCYAGWVDFGSMNAALAYLAQYFDLQYCSLENGDNQEPSIRMKEKQVGLRISNAKKKTESPADPEIRITASIYHCLGNLQAGLTFTGLYDCMKNFFERKRQYVDFVPPFPGKAPWPKNAGLYAIWENKAQGALLYLGMTGKFTTDGKLKVGNGLKGRETRTVPYSFTCKGPYEGFWEYGAVVNSPKELGKIKPEDRYKGHIIFSEIRVECFWVSATGNVAPTFLESLLMQAYLEEYNRLPIANNEF